VHQNTFGQKGLFPGNRIEKGEFIAELKGKEIGIPTKYSIQISGNVHLEMDCKLRYMNHHCSPTAEINGRNLVALKDIDTGEEITIDYNKTERHLSHPFQCKCCGRWIKGCNKK